MTTGMDNFDGVCCDSSENEERVPVDEHELLAKRVLISQCSEG